MIDFFGIPVHSVPDDFLTMTEQVPNFPPSKHRSKRIEKKLIKRHGYTTVKTKRALILNNRVYMEQAAWSMLRKDTSYMCAVTTV